jgi:hypothetical protein
MGSRMPGRDGSQAAFCAADQGSSFCSNWVAVVTLLAVGLVGICGCSWEPIKDLTSLSPAVQASSVGYNEAAGYAAEQILVTDILSAKDFEPLNLSQLSSISGALSFQGSLGFTIPFGVSGRMGGNKASTQNSGTPAVTASTTPTFTQTPLNTQGFTLTIMQPIFANYVLSLLQNGLPPEVLLSLFIKEIDFPADVRPYRYINDPDDLGHFYAFQSVIADLVRHEVTLKVVDISEPVGPQFNLYAAPSNAGTQTTYYTKDHNQPVPFTPPNGTPSGSAYHTVQTTLPNPQVTNADPTGYNLVTGSSDAQYHVANAGNGGQLYRVYSGQIAMCVNTPWVAGHRIPTVTVPVVPTIPRRRKRAKEDFREQSAEMRVHLASLTTPTTLELGAPLRRDGVFDVALQSPLELPAVPAPGTGAPSTTSPSGMSGGSHGGGGGPSSSGGTPSQATTATLQAPRISALLSDDTCERDEIILDHFSDKILSSESKSFVHIYWRSVQETLAHFQIESA